MQYVPPNARWSAASGLPSLPLVPTDDDKEEERRFALSLGAVIAKVRLGVDVSQEELAEATGVSVTTLSRWERGVNAPKAYQLAKIWRKLEPPASWFFDPPDALSDLDRRLADAVERGRDAAYAPPRRRATRRGGGERGGPRSQRRGTGRRGSPGRRPPDVRK